MNFIILPRISKIFSHEDSHEEHLLRRTTFQGLKLTYKR